MAEALRWSRELCELEAAPAHRLLRAQVLLQARQAAEAQTLVQPLLADPIWAVDARLALCHAALQTGDYAEAGRRLAEISPAEVTPAVLQMMVTYERARGAWDDCMVRCRQVLALDPECYWAKSALGACLFHAGRTEEAIEQLQHSVGLLHGQADAHLHLGQALQKLGHDEWAERAYQTTLTIDSLQPEAHEGLGAIYRTRDQPVLASRHYEQAMAIRRHLQQRHGGRPAGA
jgi:Flp pilus assembly protein TadD